jgi:hypothetical protein
MVTTLVAFADIARDCALTRLVKHRESVCQPVKRGLAGVVIGRVRGSRIVQVPSRDFGSIMRCCRSEANGPAFI